MQNRMTLEEFEIKMKEVLGYRQFEVVGEFNGINRGVTVICTDCGHKFSARSARSLLTKYGCNNCIRLSAV